MISKQSFWLGLLVAAILQFNAAGVFADSGPLPRHEVENEHVSGLLDHSNFRFVGRQNPGGPYSAAMRGWTDLYGYAYDGDDPALSGKKYAYVSTGGFGRRPRFTREFAGGVAVFDVTEEGDPDFLGTILPSCDTDNCGFLIRDIEIHDGVAYFSSDRGLDTNGGTFVMDLRADPINPPQLAQLNSPSFGALNQVHEIGLDVVSPNEAYLYTNDSVIPGTVDIFSVGNARESIQKVATINDVPTHGVFANDGFLYVTGDDRTTVFDVSDLSNSTPQQIGEFLTPGGFTHSSWPDTYEDSSGVTRHVLYVAHEAQGTDLQVWDVTDILDGTNSAGAELIATITNDDLAATQGTGPVTNVHNLFLVDDILFTSWTAAGMVVIDVSDPTNPSVIDTFDTSAVENSSNFVGNFGVNPSLGMDRILLSDRSSGLWVVDVSNIVPEPATPPYAVFALATVLLLRRRKFIGAEYEGKRTHRA